MAPGYLRSGAFLCISRKPGEPHPFEIGKEAIARYFVIGHECGEAAKLRFEDLK